jgi:hypothetical protein
MIRVENKRMKTDTIKVLILSRTPWAKDNSFGNTFSNLFGGIENIVIANICCQHGRTDDDGLLSYVYQITESELINNIRDRNIIAGHQVYCNNDTALTYYPDQERYAFARKHRNGLLIWARDIIWKYGKWENDNLKAFIKQFDPDLLYIATYQHIYMLDVAIWLQEVVKVPTILHVSDDVYSMKQFSCSPFFWINRILVRKRIRRLAENCSFMHVITELQKREYEKALGVQCRIFRKSSYYKTQRPVHQLHDPITLVYTGGIGDGRWCTLCAIARVLDNINASEAEKRVNLIICSNTILTKKMEKALASYNSIVLKRNVESNEYISVQYDADVLLITESFNIKDKLKYRLSLSTKVVDYLCTGNCILAIGDSKLAEIDYLSQNKAAIIIDDYRQIEARIREIIYNTELIDEYGRRAWEFGKKNHNAEYVKKEFMQDLVDAVEKNELSVTN